MIQKTWQQLKQSINHLNDYCVDYPDELTPVKNLAAVEVVLDYLQELNAEDIPYDMYTLPDGNVIIEWLETYTASPLNYKARRLEIVEVRDNQIVCWLCHINGMDYTYQNLYVPYLKDDVKNDPVHTDV